MTGRRTWPVWIATCGGVGYFPLAPGTLGAAIGVLLVAAGQRLPPRSPVFPHSLGAAAGWTPCLWLTSAAAIIFGVGVWAAGAGERFFGRVDPGPVVIDEVAGQLVTFLGRPGAAWKWLVVGFVLFRAFDVVKPFPARPAEHLPGGWGIMLDDVVAGAYALASLSLLELVFR